MNRPVLSRSRTWWANYTPVHTPVVSALWIAAMSVSTRVIPETAMQARNIWSLRYSDTLQTSLAILLPIAATLAYAVFIRKIAVRTKLERAAAAATFLLMTCTLAPLTKLPTPSGFNFGAQFLAIFVLQWAWATKSLWDKLRDSFDNLARPT